MRKISLMSILGLLLLMVPFAHAQETVFELPAIGDGESVVDSFDNDVTTYLYGFHASSGDSVTITMIQDSADLDPFIVLLDSNGAVLAYDDDSGNVPLSARIENFDIADDGVYFVLATSFNFVDGTVATTDNPLPYELTIAGQTVPDDVEDADVVSLEIPLLERGNLVEGESSEDAPAALFFFEGEDGDTVLISIEDAEFISVLHVFAPDGSRIGVDPSIIELDLEDDGVYLVIATDFFFYEAIDNGGFFEGGFFILVIQ